ncbi:tryptophan-rich sensory protein [uncultured Amnibacterium sp.]|uniref:tryptophan-rich sensory protein n=1 Tax=uncultured Amnibacterium sp. TaxID=1631851 RepID=UPI0035CA486E
MRNRDAVRVGTVAVSIVLALVGSAIGSGAFGGTPIQDAAGGALAADATLLAPGTGAFQIWSVIYLGLIAYAVLQALPGQRHSDRQRRIGWLAAASMLLNAAWILSVQFGLLLLSVPVIVGLLLVLVALVLRLGPAASLPQRILTDGVFGLYLGWVAIATVANVTALLQQAGFSGAGVAPEAWAVVVLAVAVGIGVATSLRTGGRVAPALSLAWGLAWIAVARAVGQPQSALVTTVAAVAAALVLAAPLLVRLRVRNGVRSSAA